MEQPPAPTPPEDRSRHRRRVIAALVLVACAAVVGLTGWFWLARPSRDGRSPVKDSVVQAMQRRFDWTGYQVKFGWEVARNERRSTNWGILNSGGESCGGVVAVGTTPVYVAWEVGFPTVPPRRPDWPVPATGGGPEEQRAVETAVSVLHLSWYDRQWQPGDLTVTSITPSRYPPPRIKAWAVEMALAPGVMRGATRVVVDVIPDGDRLWRVVLPELRPRG